MRITSITIQNFKGIKHTKIELIPTGANIYTLIGLNESGKTTILEAISTFNINKDETGALYGVNIDDVKPTSYVPKGLKSNFTGEITVQVEIEFDTLDKQKLAEWVKKKTKWKLINSSIPNKVNITRGYKFENSDFKSKIYTIGGFNVKATLIGNTKIETIPSTHLVWDKGTDFIVDRFPEILYFPTFIFNQPEKIVLNPTTDEKPINRLYREILGNVASSLDRPLDIHKHIVDRILGTPSGSEKVLSFFMLPADKQQQIEASLNEISAHITQTVFGSWTKIFGGDFSEREIVLKLGVQNNNDQQEVYIQFAIKDRKSTYDIAERSLGFRWFFSFLLFTFYRKSNAGKSTLFLLDEPASNLHARAQMQLLDNLSKIAINGNQILSQPIATI
ncbi:MAG TPA: AAA family ATPase [Flavisolibacter sp.]|jgi:energy-coupling factor transporter ATP-binding protein EcfA2|nr:AAA family ATPase [Flavisolibacter sp.]